MNGINDIQTQMTEKFKNPQFTIQFMVDNNPIGIINQLKKMGYSSLFTGVLGSDKMIVKKVMYDMYVNKKQPILFEILNNVSYLNEGDESETTLEYTKGYRDYVIDNTPTGSVSLDSYNGLGNSKFSWDGLLAGLGAGLTTYGSMSSIGGAGTTPLDAQAQAEADKARKSKQMWTIIGVTVAVIALVGLGIVIYKSKKK